MPKVPSDWLHATHPNPAQQNRANQIHVIFLALVAVSCLAAFFVAWAHQFVPQQSAPSVDLIVDNLKGQTLPEPREQFTFGVLAVLIPILIFVAAMHRSRSDKLTQGAATRILPPVAIATLILFPFFQSTFVPTVVRDFLKSYSWIDDVFIAIAVLAAFGFCLLAVRRGSNPQDRSGKATAMAWTIFVAAMALQLISWRLVSFSAVEPSNPWNSHADPLLYVLSQVVAGKTVLSLLPSQYGLFPEFLGPIFRLTGLTVWSMTSLFACMQVLSMVAVFWVLSRLVRNRALLALAGIALVQLTFETVILFAGDQERYFQYWPLRFFWPAISVATFYWFVSRPSFVRAASLSAVGAIALLWNLDSGLFTSLAFAAYLFSRGLASWLHAGPRRPNSWRTARFFAALFVHVVVTLAIVFACLAALQLKAGQPLHLDWLFKYQQAFAQVGLMMLPMPQRPDAWMAVLGAYAAGMLIAFSAWRDSSEITPRADTLFYLSMLGLGLFVYYAGRSHVFNLVTVCWPALVVGTIIADQLLRAIRAKTLSAATLAIPVATCALIGLAAGSFVARVPFLVNMAAHRFETRGIATAPIVASELAFVKQHAPEGSTCLVLSYRQGVYHAEAKVTSPYDGPGLIETVLAEDERTLLDALYAGTYRCVIVGVGPDSASATRLDMARLLNRYAVRDETEGRTMLFLEPKDQ